VNDLDHWRETVRGAGCRRQQPVLSWVVVIVIDAYHDVQGSRIFDRSRDDDALHTTVEIALKLIGFQELAGAFQDDIATEIAPRHITGGRCGGEANPSVADQDSAIVLGLERLPPTPMQGVELKQMGDYRGSALDLVDVDDIQPISGTRIVSGPIQSAECGPHCQSPDPTHTVNADPHAQTSLPRISAASGPAPISSRRAFSAIRSSLSKGRLIKIMIRR
jgi:hypothetical protein